MVEITTLMERERIKSTYYQHLACRGEGIKNCNMSQKISLLNQISADEIGSLSISSLEMMGQYILGAHFSHSTLDKKQKKKNPGLT